MIYILSCLNIPNIVQVGPLVFPVNDEKSGLREFR